MRVPTYQKQTAVSSKTGATMFSLQANAGALSAGLSAGAQLADTATQITVNWLDTQKKARQQAELDDAGFELQENLQKLKVEQETRSPNDILADNKKTGSQSFRSLGQAELNAIANKISDSAVRRQFIVSARDKLSTTSISVNQSARNRLIDQNRANIFTKADQLKDTIVMGNSAEREQAILDLFGDEKSGHFGLYDKAQVDGYFTAEDAVKEKLSAESDIEKRIKQADLAILDSNVTKRVLIAGNTQLPVPNRQAAVDTLFGEIKDAEEKKTINAAEAETRRQSVISDTVRAIGNDILVRAPDATAAVFQMQGGVIEDPVLAGLVDRMAPDEKMKVLNDFYVAAVKRDNERRENEEADNEKADADNDRAYASIINVDQSDENALAAAKRLHKALLKDNYYSPTDRKAAETILGLNKKPKADGKQGSKRSAIKILSKADNDNILTQTLVESLSEDLSLADYKSFMDKARTEGKEGRTAAKSLISSRLRYNEFKDSNNALGDAADQMFQSSMFELDDWLNTPKQDDGGAGATYQETVKKARDIIKENDVEFKRQYKEALVEFVNSQTTLFPGLVVDPARPVESTLEHLRSLNTPNDPLVKGVVRTIKSYRKLLVDN